LTAKLHPPNAKTEATQTQTDKPAPGDNVVTYDFKPKNRGMQEAERGSRVNRRKATKPQNKRKRQIAGLSGFNEQINILNGVLRPVVCSDS